MQTRPGQTGGISGFGGGIEYYLYRTPVVDAIARVGSSVEQTATLFVPGSHNCIFDDTPDLRGVWCGV